jgi:hypothetical protein
MIDKFFGPVLFAILVALVVTDGINWYFWTALGVVIVLGCLRLRTRRAGNAT